MKAIQRISSVTGVSQISPETVNDIKKNKHNAITKTLKGIRSYNEEPDVINPLKVTWEQTHFELRFDDGREMNLYPEEMLHSNWPNRIWDYATTRMPVAGNGYRASKFDFRV